MIYLDNAATSFPKPECVIDALNFYTKNIGASAGRGAYKSSIKSSSLLFETRSKLAKFLGLSNPLHIFFTYNATYAINFALFGFLKEGDRVGVSSIEHNAIMRPLKHLELARNIKIDIIPTNADCELDLHAMAKLAKEVKMLICTGANNVTGAILPLEKIKQIARDSHTTLMIDASQILGIAPFDIDGIDILCGNAHKGLLGIMGLGFCIINSSNITLDSLIFGGTGSASESIFQPDLLPDKFESGTQNMHAIAALNVSLDYIKEMGIEKIFTHENDMRIHLIEGLKSLPNVKVIDICNSYKSNATLSFTCKDIAKVAHLLDKNFDICARSGLHCSPMTHKTLNTLESGGTIRLSPGIFTTKEELDKTIQAIKELTK